jgi:hypothetical membrane protein
MPVARIVPEGVTGVRFCKLAAWGGIAGPVLFTAAWMISSLRQAGYSPVEVQLSGLAAEDAADPHIMMAGFVVLGACSLAFGAELARSVAPRSPGPWLVMAGGVATMAAGVFRRDHMLLTGPGFAGESWHNQVHDVASAVAYAAMLTAPLILGRRFRDDPRWAVLSRPVQGLALASAIPLVVFLSQVAEPWNGVVQRAAVTLGLAAEVALAARMLTSPPGSRASLPRDRKPTAPARQQPGRRSPAEGPHATARAPSRLFGQA